MTNEAARQLAQQSPVLAATTRLGELKAQADKEVANLCATLKHLDETRELLNQHGLQMVVDLGDIGNAAAVARRQVADVKGTPVFALPERSVA